MKKTTIKQVTFRKRITKKPRYKVLPKLSNYIQTFILSKMHEYKNVDEFCNLIAK